jgi:hypothetical protein
VPDRGPPRDEYSRSHREYHDALRGGTTHTSYGVSHGTMYPQALPTQSSSLQPGILVGYDMAPYASRPPPIPPRPPTESIQIHSVQSADYPLGFVFQQSLRQMNLASSSSEGSAGAWDLLAGSHSHRPTSESHASYNPGGFRVVRQQNPRPIAAAPPSQGPEGVQNLWVPSSQVYFNFTFLHRPLPEDNRTTMAAEKRKAVVVCNVQTA